MKQINIGLKCGLHLDITRFQSVIRAELIGPDDKSISGFAKQGNQLLGPFNKLVLYISADNLPILRDVLNQIDPPKSKWYEFWSWRS